jgi:two-component system, sporulation sensor kinase E
MTATAPRSPERADVAAAALLDPAHVAALLELSADAIITVSPDEHVTSWNRGAREMFGYAAEEIVGRPFTMLLPDEERARGEIRWIHDTTVAHGAIRDHETRRRRKDGTIIEVSLTRTVVKDRDGAIVGFTAILRDITYRKRLERQILSAERLATAGQVSAGVAHEIGAPLTAIAMTVEHMLRLRCQSCAGADQMRILQSQTDRLARLARQLVDLAKPAALTPGPVQLAEVAAASASLLRSQFAQRGARILVEVPADLPTIRGDAAHLQQVLLNLLFNSLRVVPEGRGEVVIAAHAEGGIVIVTVTDNGPGIPADDLPHLFRPFFSRSGSTGLGLALAAQIVQAHRGTLEAASPPGRGAVFTITLPSQATHG